MRATRSGLAVAMAALVVIALGSCEREARQLRPEASVLPPVQGREGQAPLHAGPGPAPAFQRGTLGVRDEARYESNAYALSEGKRLYGAFNCSGCHGNGGGSIGPPLMDAAWRYGPEPEQIYWSIVEGRPNGMPSFAGRIPEYEVWELVAYVRSLSGLVPEIAAPGRNDAMRDKPPENSMSAARPVPESPPSAASP